MFLSFFCYIKLLQAEMAALPMNQQITPRQSVRERYGKRESEKEEGGCFQALFSEVGVSGDIGL